MSSDVGCVAIVGPGRIGQALGKLLAEAGVLIRCVAARRLSRARRATRFIGAGRAVGLDAPQIGEAQVLLVTVADSALVPVATKLADSCDWRGEVALHTCGSMPASVLEPLRRRGAAVGALHPFQTVPTPAAGVQNLVGAYWGLDGDRAALKVARHWVKLLGGVAFPVRADRKVLYHAAAFLTCPTVVALMAEASRLLEQAGVPARIWRPMLGRFVAETARNFAALGPERALTGPVARGDWPTIRKHLDGLRRFAPAVVPVYMELVRSMLRLKRGATQHQR